MKKFIGLFCFIGIWIVPATAVAWYALNASLGRIIPLTVQDLMPGIRLGFLIWLLHMMVALTTFENGKPLEKYGLLGSLLLSTDPYAHIDERRLAQHKAPPKNLLAKSLKEGIVIGRRGERLVIIPLLSGNASHTLICGITGSGKSSCCVIPTVMAICGGYRTDDQHGVSTTAFIFDIKKELYTKAALHKSPGNFVIDPDDRTSCGWDLFWELRGNHSDIQLMTDVISDICYTVIPPQPGSENGFFIDGGRDLLFGLLLYYYRSGTENFIDCVDLISGKPMMDQVREVLNGRSGTIEYKTLVKFSGMDEKTFADVATNAMNGLSLYIKDQAIRYMLRDNPTKLNPTMLETHNVFLCMEDYHLENWSQIVTMLSNQTMNYILRREEGSHVILCIIDEWANVQQRAGKIKSLPAFLALGRSHGGCAILVSQSLPALEAGGTKKEEVQTMLNNIPYKVILSAGDNETQRWIVSQAGKIPVTKHSHGRSGSNKSSNYTKEEKDILDAELLTTLPKEDQVVVLSTDYGYFSCSRSPYYKTKALKLKWDEIKVQNKI